MKVQKLRFGDILTNPYFYVLSSLLGIFTLNIGIADEMIIGIISGFITVYFLFIIFFAIGNYQLRKQERDDITKARNGK